jgi:hypothetical protein
MKRYKFVAFSRPVDGREEEYLRWIDGHAADVMRTPGYVSAQRYRASGPSQGGLPANLVIYEIETNDIESTVAGLNERGRTGDLAISEALDFQGLVFGLYSEETAVMLAPAAFGTPSRSDRWR